MKNLLISSLLSVVCMLFIQCTDNRSDSLENYIKLDPFDFAAVESLEKSFGVNKLQIDESRMVLADKANNTFTIPVKHYNSNQVSSREYPLICVQGDIKRPKFGCKDGVGLCEVRVRFLGGCSQSIFENDDLGTAILQDDNVVLKVRKEIEIDWSKD